jgi:O-antigen biosynthesis protein
MSDAPHPAPRISVVIVNYNVRDLLESCLHSVVSALEAVPGEILVVDNASDDGSADMVRQKFPGAVLIESDRNLGFARANNLALARARGAYLLLLNPDTLVQEDTLQTMLSFFETHPATGMAGCKILTPDGSLEPACRRSFPSPWVAFTKLAGLGTLFRRSRIFARYNLTYLDEDATYEVDAISGSFMLLRREVYAQIGGLDESYFMYGEDLDWCYRVQKAGWRIHYVHATKIVHYGGESTRRSSIDAQAVFYEAMELFVKKNLHPPAPLALLITLGIRLRLLLSRSAPLLRRVAPVAADALLAVLALAVAELAKNGALFHFPARAYPTMYVAMTASILIGLLGAGAYTHRDNALLRGMAGTLASFLFLSSLTYFFKDYAFSRFVVLLASGIAGVLITARRAAETFLLPQRRTSVITGRPTLLVGLNEQALSILDRLRQFDASIYRIVGIIDVTNRHLGEKFHGVPVIGSVENIAKVIPERGITDVIFAPDVLAYADILSIINRTKGHPVQYRVVPKSMEFIVGKSGVDQLSSVPLIDVDYNLLRLRNRAAKRALDVAVALSGLIPFAPFVFLLSAPRTELRCSFRRFIRALPAVLSGRMSLVGLPEGMSTLRSGVYLGKTGITGLIQLRHPDELHEEERIKLAIQYARNHSVFLDVEILIRTILVCLAGTRGPA